MKSYTIVAFATLAFVVLALVATWALLHANPNRGTFGDMFGVANALFSGVVFVGVTYAIFLQREEIRIAREDIKYTKEILDKQQEHLALQNEETKRQIFENTFFRLLTLFTELTGQMDMAKPGGAHEGKDVALELIKRFASTNGGTGIPDDPVAFDTFYALFYGRYGNELSHYFRTLYQLIKFIDRAAPHDAKFYSDIVRAQLSDAEVGLLFYNGLSINGRDKFKPLIEKYALLKHLRDAFASSVVLKARYAPEAYL